MSDNLEIIEQNIDAAIDPGAGIGGIKAADHNAVLKEVLNKAGKFAGVYFTASGALDGLAPIGTLLWNGEAPNTVTDFTIRLSKLSTDGNDVGLLLDQASAGSVIHFKDKLGRSFFLKYQSHATGTDGNTNDIYDVVVQGDANNSNYVYQAAETNVSSITIYNAGGGTVVASTVEYGEGAEDPTAAGPLVTAFLAANPGKMLFWYDTNDEVYYYYHSSFADWELLTPEQDPIPVAQNTYITPSGGNFDFNGIYAELDSVSYNGVVPFTFNLNSVTTNNTTRRHHYFINESDEVVTFTNSFGTLVLPNGKLATMNGKGVVRIFQYSDGANAFWVLSGDLDESGGGGSGIGGTLAENQIAFGSAAGEVEGSAEFTWDDVNLIIRGSGADRYQRWVESLGQFNGAYFHYEGSTNKFHIGVHATGDNLTANDQKVLTLLRSNGFVGIFNDNPQFELDVVGTFNIDGARIAPTFANFTNRIAVVNPSFGSSRLGDGALQSPSLDVQVINFMDDVGQVSNFAIFENNDVLTVRSGGGNFVGVFDFNGANQADYASDNAEATYAATINYTNGFGYVSDVGVQRYLPGVSVVAQTFFDVMINSGGAPRLQHIKTYYDGTTYDPIRTIETDGRMIHKKVVEFEEVTKGIPGVSPEDFVTVSQLAGGNSTWKDNVKVATTANITLSGNQTIDGNAVADGERVLVKDQTNQVENGIYIVDSGAWSRSSDFDDGEEQASATMYVENGSANFNKYFQCDQDATATIGSSNLTFTEVDPFASGGGGAFVDLVNAQTIGGSKTFTAFANLQTGASIGTPTGSANLYMRNTGGDPNGAGAQLLFDTTQPEGNGFNYFRNNGLTGKMYWRNLANNRVIDFTLGRQHDGLSGGQDTQDYTLPDKSGTIALLDDTLQEDQGTWTPVFADSGTSTVYNIGGSPDTYIKQGKIVYCTCDIQSITHAGSPTGTLLLRTSSLPFPVQSVNGLPSLLNVYFEKIENTAVNINQILGLFQNWGGSNGFSLYFKYNATPDTEVDTNFPAPLSGSTMDIRFTFSYVTTA